MKISFTQSGGYAGIVRACSFDTSAIPQDQKEELERRVAESMLSSSGVFTNDTGRDLQQYDLVIDDGARKVQVTFDDTTLPKAVKPLVGFLKQHARPATPK